MNVIEYNNIIDKLAVQVKSFQEGFSILSRSTSLIELGVNFCHILRANFFFSDINIFFKHNDSNKGKLMGGPESQEFHDKLSTFLGVGKKNIIVDLSDVKYVNSSGLGNLVRGFSSVKEAGGQLKLAGVSDKVEGVLSITKLLSVFELFNTVEEAAKSFQ